MSNTKISALTSATTPLAGTETLPIVQSSATTKVTVANLTAGRSVSMADATLSTGNLILSTAAKGVNFTANTPAAGMTSQLLNWYEEGTWTPSVGGTATYSGQTGKYTRMGRQVTVIGDMTILLLLTGSATTISGLPFTASGGGSMMAYYWSGIATNMIFISGTVSGTSIQITGASAATGTALYLPTIFQNGARLQFSATYFV